MARLTSPDALMMMISWPSSSSNVWLIVKILTRPCSERSDVLQVDKVDSTLNFCDLNILLVKVAAHEPLNIGDLRPTSVLSNLMHNGLCDILI